MLADRLKNNLRGLRVIQRPNGPQATILDIYGEHYGGYATDYLRAYRCR